MNVAERNDADLVAESLAGSREAFHAIVKRYQTLICSLAYSATGNVSQSEDVAQETFITAWTDLRSLREPDKLRSWLCGIVRNRIHRSLRSEGREPACGAAALEEAHDSPAIEALPSEQAISREEEAILWRSVEKIPKLYREPFILFYRQHQSIGHVAAELELSEDAVKQRLLRGRKLVQDEVQAFVENTLRRTAPGQSFSVAVLAALPLAAGSAATAGAGMGAKGAAAVKSGFLTSWLWILAPFLGVFAGAASSCLIVSATTTGHKSQVKMMLMSIAHWILMLAFAWGGEVGTRLLGGHFGWNDQIRFVSMAVWWWFCMGVFCTCSISNPIARSLAKIRQRDDARGNLPQVMTPIKPGILAASVTGFSLAIFFPLTRIAWNAGDRVTAGIAIGIMLALSGWSVFRLRTKDGATFAWSSLNKHFGLAFLLFLGILNLRLDVWMASGYGVSVAEVHRLQPLWIIPLLTLALLLWVGLAISMAKRRQ
jgi:RNA polymerase sigma factor (sigma-70 family)